MYKTHKQTHSQAVTCDNIGGMGLNYSSGYQQQCDLFCLGTPHECKVTSVCDSAPWWHDMRWHTFRNSQWLDARGCMSSISFSGVTDWELLGVTWLPAGCTGKWQYERNDKMTRIRWQENDKMRSHSFIFFRLLVVWCCMMLYDVVWCCMMLYNVVWCCMYV